MFYTQTVSSKEVLCIWRVWPQTPAPTLGGAKNLSVLMGVDLLVDGHTWKSALHDRPSEDLLGELRLVVILISHGDHNLHRLLDCLPVWRHSMREELQEPGEGYLGRQGGRSGPTRAEWAPPGPHSLPLKYARTPPCPAPSTEHPPHTCCCFSEVMTLVKTMTCETMGWRTHPPAQSPISHIRAGGRA